MPDEISPQISVKKENEKLEIFCSTLTPGEWKHGNKKIAIRPNVQVMSGAKGILIKKITTMNKGVYTCNGQTHGGTYFYSQSILKVVGEFSIMNPQRACAREL